MELEPFTILILIFVFFIAGFIDSIAGGGGILTIPALFLAGIPPQTALGTSKFASTFGTGVAVINFAVNKKITYKVITHGILFSLAGALLGTKVILLINQAIAGKIIIFMLPFAIIATLLPQKAKPSGLDSLSAKDYYLKIPLICFVIGFYDGFFGPGTGSFLTLLFYLFTKMSLIGATANTKVFNLVSNAGGLVVFIISVKVLFILAIPLALANITGNFFGSKLAINKGDKIVKIFLLIIFIILMTTSIFHFQLYK